MILIGQTTPVTSSAALFLNTDLAFGVLNLLAVQIVRQKRMTLVLFALKIDYALLSNCGGYWSSATNLPTRLVLVRPVFSSFSSGSLTVLGYSARNLQFN